MRLCKRRLRGRRITRVEFRGCMGEVRRNDAAGVVLGREERWLQGDFHYPTRGLIVRYRTGVEFEPESNVHFSHGRLEVHV